MSNFHVFIESTAFVLISNLVILKLYSISTCVAFQTSLGVGNLGPHCDGRAGQAPRSSISLSSVCVEPRLQSGKLAFTLQSHKKSKLFALKTDLMRFIFFRVFLCVLKLKK